MQIQRVSASAMNSYPSCNFRYFCDQVLRLGQTSGKAATLGNICHEVFELMARLKMRGKTNVDPYWLFHRAWGYHTGLRPDLDIRRYAKRVNKKTGVPNEMKDYTVTMQSFDRVLDDPYYNPYNLKVIGAEHKFEIDFPGDAFLTRLGKQLFQKGFIDLVHEIDEDTIEIVDWKTGEQKDFHTGEPIDFDYLIRSIQPRLYHMAALVAFPQYKNVIVTFYYTKGDGPISFALDEQHILPTIETCLKFKDTVEADTVIKRNRSWKCRMCSYDRSGICDPVWSDMCTNGTEYVKQKYYGLSYNDQKLLCEQNSTDDV